jgi:hypothetical protein
MNVNMQTPHQSFFNLVSTTRPHLLQGALDSFRIDFGAALISAGCFFIEYFCAAVRVNEDSKG